MKGKPGMSLTILAGLPKPKGKKEEVEAALEDDVEEFDDLAAEDEEMDAEDEDMMDLMDEEEVEPAEEFTAAERVIKAVEDKDPIALESSIEELVRSIIAISKK